jgi:hypothetical protein
MQLSVKIQGNQSLRAGSGAGSQEKTMLKQALAGQSQTSS